MFKLEPMDPISKEDMERLHKDKEGNINPFNHDLFNMGMEFSKDIMFMFRSHKHEKYTSGYFINTKTGERQRLIWVNTDSKIKDFYSKGQRLKGIKVAKKEMNLGLKEAIDYCDTLCNYKSEWV